MHRHPKAPVEDIIALTSELIRHGAVSTGLEIHDEGIQASYHLLRDFLRAEGLNVITFHKDGRFPAIYCDAGPLGSPPRAKVLVAGHYDVVPPAHPAQLEPVVDGDWLRGRGSADMLTVVATLVTFMRSLRQRDTGGRDDAPAIGILLVSNEESGETEAWGTPFVLRALKERYGYVPSTFIAGERTGDGSVKHGLIEIRNRGIIRAHLSARGEAAHTALAKRLSPIGRILETQRVVKEAIAAQTDAFWKTTFQVSYFHGGALNNFNITAREAVAGFEIRIAHEGEGDRLRALMDETCTRLDIEVDFLNQEPAVIASPDDERVLRLVAASAAATGVEATDLIGPGKLPGTQARFAPSGCVGIVWGQAGVGPHSDHEAHYIPSIQPYFSALCHVADTT